ncbi:uncharacterized protein C12orf56 homolog isoform X2 [Anabas testudineus]|uniref:Uncharacterized protein n=1 Tax=Anabas testudineus TaxID=64144 RepID=A0AAQ6IB60_ANATE|nr:uncharacterized protein C12orf56 homolog isoform X2 [Anabas testudineus]
MARTGSRTLLYRRNVKLDSFLKRNTDRAVYERIRTYEPCVVVSDTVNKVYMHAVLSDECVYLTEHTPRTLTAAVSFRRVRDIELVNDLPDFLSGKDREHCQHIRITCVTEKPTGKAQDRLSRGNKGGLSSSTVSSRKTSHCPSISDTLEGYPAQRNNSEWRNEEVHIVKPMRSASCPNSETLGLLRVPHPPTQPSFTAPYLYSTTSSSTLPISPSDPSLKTLQGGQVLRRIGSVVSRLLRRDCVKNEEEREVELHLYAVSHTSRLYLHLQSLWNSFIIRSTLLLDPLYRKRHSASSDSSPGKQCPAISWERMAHLFGQLSSELLQEGISVENVYLLLQELRTAAHHSVTLRRLFWRSNEVCIFLVQTLEESLHSFQTLNGVYTADQLLLSTVIVQTLAVMFRETEDEAARINQLSAKKGALASRILLALVCNPQIRTDTGGSQFASELQALLSEYLDGACSLLFELLLVGYETSRCFSAENILSVGWILQVLQPHPHLLAFIGYQAQQLVLVLSDQQESVLGPLQSVLLFQRCRLLLACLQNNSQLAQHLESHFKEEFRYFVKPSCGQEKLPPHYPISKPTLRLVEHILSLILHK